MAILLVLRGYIFGVQISMNKNKKLLWFGLGLGTQLQLIASLSFTELFCFLATPVLLPRLYPRMKKDGVVTLFVLSVMMVLGCSMSCLYNHTVGAFALRGHALAAVVVCSIVVFYWLIREDPLGFRWYLIGYAISKILCTFIFQQTFEVQTYAGGMAGEGAVEGIMSGPIFWIGRLKPFVTWPTQAFYLHTPMWLDIVAFLFMGLFSILTTTSGRAAALMSFASILFVLLGRKHIRTMRIISRQFVLIVFLGIGFVFAAKMLYSVAATRGLLGNEARDKYENQTKTGTGIMNLLMSGRAESFIGLFACFDSPLFGKGPWAMDTEGYTERFILKYGAAEDIEFLERSRRDMARYGMSPRLMMIPGHSHITMLWLWFGLPGLVFILYCAFVLVRFLKDDCYIIPQWFGWLTCAVPGLFWHICFSGFADRVGFPLFIVACLMARAVRKGSFTLPPEVLMEIDNAERRRR